MDWFPKEIYQLIMSKMSIGPVLDRENLTTIHDLRMVCMQWNEIVPPILLPKLDHIYSHTPKSLDFNKLLVYHDRLCVFKFNMSLIDFSKLEKLTSLISSNCHTIYYGNSPHLKTLRIVGGYHPDIASNISGLTNLTNLQIVGNCNVSRSIPALVQLRSLHLERTDIDDILLANIIKLTNLTNLTLQSIVPLWHIYVNQLNEKKLNLRIEGCHIITEKRQ